jgi:internalin A
VRVRLNEPGWDRRLGRSGCIGLLWYGSERPRAARRAHRAATLHCSFTQVSDLGPLAALTALQWLECSFTQVSGLGPLAALTALQWLNCFDTQVSDLGPLVALTALQWLNCSETHVSDLGPLNALTALQTLVCSRTPVSDLRPLAALTALQWLNCSLTPVSDLRPLAALTALQSLNCSLTPVSDLGPLVALTALQTLNCSGTRVSDLGPLAGLTALQQLACSETQVSDLSPLAGLTALQRLDLSQCSLSDLPLQLLHHPALAHLVMHETRVPGVPAAVLSQAWREDCLDSLRTHVADLKAGRMRVPDVKLLVLGNGGVGKTQLCRRLRDEDYDECVPSTHGISVTGAPLETPDDQARARLHLWDFGGQDLYHGTHVLFTRTSAIALLAWSPATENADAHVIDGTTFRNHPLDYWVDYARHLGHRGSPVLVIQTRCDSFKDDVPCPVAEAKLFAAFPWHKLLRYSARTERGRDALNEALAEATQWLRERDGIAVIGRGRYRVQQKLEALRDADAARPPGARQYRTLTQAHFQRLCEEAGDVSSPEHLLAYLHTIGIVFYQRGLFGDAIILDQGWALDAIYAVFDRENSYRHIRRQHVHPR